MTVLLATFNGDKYLREQLDSILNQEDVEVTLVAADDGSTDETVEILESYASQNRLVILSTVSSGGFVHNFERLLKAADNSDAFCLADQDDIWRLDKVSRLLSALEQSPDRVAAFSDMSVLRGDDVPDTWSFLDQMRCPKRAPSRNEIPLQNWMSGNASIYKSSLLRVALPIPVGVKSHDWWLAFVAVQLGDVGFVDDQLVYYRQHAKNVEGVKQRLARRLVSNPARSACDFRAKVVQLGAFCRASLERRELSAATNGLVEATAAHFDPSPLARVRKFSRSGLRYSTLDRYLAHMAALALLRPAGAPSVPTSSSAAGTVSGTDDAGPL